METFVVEALLDAVARGWIADAIVVDANHVVAQPSYEKARATALEEIQETLRRFRVSLNDIVTEVAGDAE